MEKKILPILFVLLVLIQPNAILMAETETKDFYLSNISAKDAAKALQKNLSELSPQPDMVVNEHKNSLAITGTGDTLEQIEGMLKQIDVIRSQVIIEAMFIEGSLSEMDKIGINWPEVEAKGKEMDLPTEQIPKFGNISPERMDMMRKMLQAGEIKANILSNPRVKVIDQEQATFKICEEIHYMGKVGTNLYELKTLEGDSGLKFTVTPTITDNTIQLSFDLQLNQVISRQIVPEASDLKIGRPVMGVRQITTAVKVKNGETAVVGGFVREKPWNKKFNALLFITPSIITKP